MLMPCLPSWRVEQQSSQQVSHNWIFHSSSRLLRGHPRLRRQLARQIPQPWSSCRHCTHTMSAQQREHTLDWVSIVDRLGGYLASLGSPVSSSHPSLRVSYGPAVSSAAVCANRSPETNRGSIPEGGVCHFIPHPNPLCEVSHSWGSSDQKVTTHIPAQRTDTRIVSLGPVYRGKGLVYRCVAGEGPDR